MKKPKNILISGTNFWNPGDDFVRDGVITILRKLFDSEILNFFFYNFNADFFPYTKFSGISNTVQFGDLDRYKNHVDYIVIAGLSAGQEIKDLYNWIIQAGLEEKVFLIGAGYENNYVDQNISQEPEATIFRNARVITGRTLKHPKFIDQYKLQYHHINCPAILSVPDVKYCSAEKRIERIGFSIQLPEGKGIINQLCSVKNYELTLQILIELSNKFEVEIVAHHKTEYFYFLELLKDTNLPVIFSSYYQDLHKIYPRYDLVITTRLHSSLFANGFGIPGIIINDTDRHTHCLQGFPHSVWVNSKSKFDQEFEVIKQKNLQKITYDAVEFKKNLLNKYIDILSNPFGLKKNNVSKSKLTKLNLGCGFDYREGYINIDGNDQLPRIDLVLNIRPGILRKSFSANSSIEIIAKDFLEHHFHWEAKELLQDFHFLLCEGGVLQLALPNIETIVMDSMAPIEEKKKWLYGGQDMGPDDETVLQKLMRLKYAEYYCHKYGWTKNSLTEELEKVGFKNIKIEDDYWNMIVYAEKSNEKYEFDLTISGMSGISSNEKENIPFFDSEQKEQLLVRNKVKKGMTVIDIGANVGKYTNMMSRLVGEQGRVFSFEPSEYAFKKLGMKITSENLNNVILINNAVYSENTNVMLNEFPDEFCSWNSLGKPKMEDPKNADKFVSIVNSVKVKAITLDTFCLKNNIDHIDYLKVDVEGAENHVLNGAKRLLGLQLIDFLQFEISKNMLDGFGTEAKRVFETLEQYNYSCHIIENDGSIGDRVSDSSSFYDNYMAIPLKNRQSFATKQTLPIHFFTIVLNGQPFIQHHIETFKYLPFEWHWHIIEGVAELKNDTAWSVVNGGKIDERLHNDGLSNDGTTEYLNVIKEDYPENVSIYRKPEGIFWDGKLEMVNAPLESIASNCLLWQIDADELWTVDQIIKTRDLFIQNPEKMAAYYYCNYFVGDNLVITSINTYGNNTGYEWLRTWRYSPGCKWKTHEPPVLGFIGEGGSFTDLGKGNVFSHEETKRAGLVFQHMAYSIIEQLQFKEIYYGYSGAVKQWKSLNKNTTWPANLCDYFDWVKDKAIVDKADTNSVKSLVKSKNKKNPIFLRQYSISEETIKIIYLRTDSIGDHIIASGMLEEIKLAYPNSKISIICQDHVAELYDNCPYIDAILSFNKDKLLKDEKYQPLFLSRLNEINADVLLNTVYSRESVTDLLAGASGATQRIAFEGDTSNMTATELEKNNMIYTHRITSPGNFKPEIERYEDYLKVIGNRSGHFLPTVWLSRDDEKFAENIFIENELNPNKVVVFFAGAQYKIKEYLHWNDILSQLSTEGYEFIILGDDKSKEINRVSTEGINAKIVNLAGQTTIRQAAALIRKSRIALGVDTALAHLAVAAKTQSLIILGGGHFGRFLPYSKLQSVACLPLSCYGCNWECPYENNICIDQLNQEFILEAFHRSINETSKKPRVFVQSSPNLPAKADLPQWKWRDTFIDEHSITKIIIGNNFENNYCEVSNKKNISKNAVGETDPIFRAESCIEQGRLEEAKLILNDVSAKEPNNLDAMNDLATILILESRIPDALLLLKKILLLDPNNEIALDNFKYIQSIYNSPADDTQPKNEALKFSVITPSYNQGIYIEQAIQSVLVQNYSNFEHIIIDGKSTDHTLTVLNKYKHLTWVSEKDTGQTNALNKGFKKTNGDIIAILNSDDYYLTGAFEKVAHAFQTNPDARIIIGDCKFTYSDVSKNMIVKNRDLTFEDILKYWDIWIPPTQPSVFFKAELLDEFGLWDESLHYAMDYDFWLRVSQKHHFKHIPEVLSAYRFHDESKSGKGNQWENFYPEWHRVYLKYKSFSADLPQTPMVSIALPFQKSKIKNARYLKSVQETILYYSNQRLQDIEILLISDIRNAAEYIQPAEFRTPVRLMTVSKLTEKSFTNTIEKEARGFSVFCPDFNQEVPDRWFHSALERLFSNEEQNSIFDPQFSERKHSLLKKNSCFGPDKLSRRERHAHFDFSVIIPTYNRSDILKLCLDHLAKQDYSPDQIEVIVCDDGSTDNTEEVVAKYDAPFALSYFKQKNSGPAAARNNGISRAKGKYLLILNDDALLEPNALKLHLETQLAQQNLKVSVLGRFSLLPEFQKTPFGHIMQNSDVLFWYNRMLGDQVYDYNHFYTCNISILRQAVIDVGMFDDDFTGPAAEDLELGYRLQKAGYRVLYKPEIQAWHHHKINPEGFCRVHQVRGHGAVTLMLKHPRLPFYSSLNDNTVKLWSHIVERMENEVNMALAALNQLEEIYLEINDPKLFSDTISRMLPYIKILNDYYEKKGILSSPHLDRVIRIREELAENSTQAAGSNVPLVSVIIPCFNYGRYLAETVESVLKQTYKNFEIIIVNDGSTDNTKEVAEKLISQYPNQSIRLINQANSGQPAISRNNGIIEAKGNYILPLDGDDKIAPTMLEKCVNVLSTQPEIAIAYTDRLDFDGVNQVVPAGDYDFAKLRYTNQISHCALYKKEMWEMIGGYRENVKGVEDWDFWVAAGALGFCGKRIPEPLFLYRRHDTGVYQEVVSNYEPKFAQIIFNNIQVYHQDEVIWAKKRLQETTPASHIQPYFSVIIPTYNRVPMLGQAIQSVLSQTYPDFEIIVVNDAGADIGPVIAQFKNNKIRFVNHPENKGLAAARNTGIRSAKGKFIALLDDDDLFYPNHLEIAAQSLCAETPVIYTDALRAVQEKINGVYQVVDKVVPYSMEFDRNKLLVGNIAPVNCFVFERQLALNAGLFDESLTTLEDWDFWIRLAASCNFKHIAEKTVQVNWRTDGTTMTSSRQKEFTQNREVIYNRNREALKNIPNLQEIINEFNVIWAADQKSEPVERKPLISIVMLTWNALEYTKKCVASIEAHTDQPYEIIFVDNGSKDGTKKYLKSLVKGNPNYRLINNSKNIGFAAGNNQGVKKAKGEYILLLNNDVLVAGGWLESMIQSLQKDEKIGMVGPITNSISGLQMVRNIPYEGDDFNDFAQKVRKVNAGKLTPRRRLAGFAMLLRKSLYEEVGGFDKSFAAGNFEDDDLCLRVKEKGYALMVDESVFIHHYGSQTFRANNVDYNQSLQEKGQRFKEKWPEIDYEKLLELKETLLMELDKKLQKANKLLAGGKAEKAREAYALILQDNPVSVNALLGLAYTLVMTEDFDDAAGMFNKIIRLYPDQAEAYNQIGVIFARKGDLEAAKSSYALAIEKAPDLIDAQRNYGDVLIESSDFENGVKVFMKILENHPDDVPSLIYMANLYLEAERYAESGVFVKRVLEIEPGNQIGQQLSEILQEYSRVQPQSGPTENQTDTGKIRSDDPICRANTLLAEGNITGAKEIYQSILEKDSESVDALLGLGYCLMFEEGFDDAAGIFNQIIKQHPENAEAYNQIGVIFARKGDLEAAKSSFALAIEKAPDLIDAQRNYGDALIESSDFENGVKVFMKILENHPDDVPTLIYMANLNLEAGRYADALVYVNRILDLDPQNQMALQLLEILDECAGAGESERPDQDTIQGNNPAADELITRANAELEKGNHGVAADFYQKILSLEPDRVEALYGLGLIHRIEEEWEEAAQYFRKIVQTEPNFAPAYVNLGSVYYAQQEIDQAYAHLTKAIGLDPHSLESRHLLTEVLIELGRFEEAVQLIMDTLKDNPDDVQTLIMIGKLHYEAGKVDESKEYFEQAAKLEPQNDVARSFLSAIES